MAAEFPSAANALPDGRTRVTLTGYDAEGTLRRVSGEHFVGYKARERAEAAAALAGLTPDPPGAGPPAEP